MYYVYVNIYAHTRRRLEEGPHILWIDNFSKFMSRSVPSISKDIFASCLWTGVSVYTSNDPDISDKIRYNDGNMIKAMPDNILDNARVVMDTLDYILEQPRNYYDTSLVKQYSVNTIPPKIDPNLYPEVKEDMEKSPHTLDTVKPKELLSENIGSNRGLLTILKKFYDDNGMGDGTCDRYITFNVDENIYFRILKVQLQIYIYIHIYTYMFLDLTI